MTTDAYSAYSSDLRRLADGLRAVPWQAAQADVESALNGQAGTRLRDLVPRAVRRAEGAYFTGSQVRARFDSLLSDGPGFWDPACGAGDLLLAAAERLPLAANLRDTLDTWGASLRGGDLQPSFVEVAKLRLFLLAAARHRKRGDEIDQSSTEGIKAFRNIKVSNAHEAIQSTHSFQGSLVINPPFGSMQAPHDCQWASGSVSQAAVMTLSAIQKLAIEHQVVAVLPDVLRSGSRYARWREEIESTIQLDQVDLYGQFDEHTDVDVFLLSGRRRRRAKQRQGTLWWPAADPMHTISEVFDVRVGTVVDNRDPHLGPASPFLTARDLGESRELCAPIRHRNFSGRLFTPPFVAIRRTSRPGLRSGGFGRASGTIVTGSIPIAVDNHVIVLDPVNGSADDCERLLKVLESPETSLWLDQRIRCRHLTVGVVRSIPWPTK